MTTDKARRSFWIEDASEDKQYDSTICWTAWSHDLDIEADPDNQTKGSEMSNAILKGDV